MELLKDTPMEVGWLVWSPNPGRTAITVAVKATFDLPVEGTSTLADEQRLITGDEYIDDDVERSLRWASDLEPLKPRGECYVVGSFHAAHGLPVERSAVAFSIGAVGKQLAISGDRMWRAKGPGEPAAISTMPLTWENAFGGAGYHANPVGRGLTGNALPNIEDPAALIQSSAARPQPAGCAPIPRSWRSRIRFAGTYDARWLAERYPGFAEDLDYRLFMAAPPDQQIDGFWRGDETIRLRHLHPLHASLETALPGLRAQAFLVRDGELADVGLRLDTIAIDADAGQAVCVWRGLTDVKDASLDDVDHLFVVHQRRDDRHAHADYATWYANALEGIAREEAGEEPEEPPDLSAPVAAPARPDSTQTAGAVLGEAEAPGAKWAHLDQAMTVRGDDSALAASLAEELARRRGVEKSAAFKPVFEDALGIAVEEEREELSPEEALALEMELALGDLDDEEEGEGRRRVREALRDGESCAGWHLRGADLSGLSLIGVDFTGAVLAGANLSGAFVRDAKFDGASLIECELSDAVFERTSFVEADLSPCRAERVRFANCSLDSMTATESYFRAARFSGCTLVKTLFEGSDLAEATFEGCKLDSVDMTRADLTEAQFTGSTIIDGWLEGVRAPRANFDKCDCSLLRASEEAVFEGASFRRTKLDGARFANAKLRGADFSLATLERADFTEAMVAQARLMGCNLRAARFDRAVLVQASLLKSDLYEARFEGANMKHADLRGANLFRAELYEAELRDARLDLANLKGTRTPPR